MYTERKIHSGLVGFLFLLAALILLAFHTIPTQRDTADLKKTIKSLQENIKTLEEKAELTSEGGLTEVEQKELDIAIPKAVDQDQIILDINKITQANDVSFNALTFSLIENAPIPTVSISAGFQGTADNIIRFLKMLETNPRKLVVKDAGVSRLETVEGLDLVNLNLSLHAFYQQKSN